MWTQSAREYFVLYCCRNVVITPRPLETSVRCSLPSPNAIVDQKYASSSTLVDAFGRMPPIAHSGKMIVAGEHHLLPAICCPRHSVSAPYRQQEERKNLRRCAGPIRRLGAHLELKVPREPKLLLGSVARLQVAGLSACRRTHRWT